MKLLCFIGAFLLLPLANIDTLMQSQPDSALTLLLDAPDNTPYYQLLLSEALYKNDYQQANRQELLEVMAYYDSVGDPFLSARCHYMNGVGYYEMDSVVPACEEYLNALEIMENHFEERKLTGDKAKFMALTYTRLFDIFTDRFLHEQAVFWGKNSLSYYKKCNSAFWHVPWMLQAIGTHYDMINQLDSADWYYKEPMVALSDTNCLLYRDVASHQAFLLYKTSRSPMIPLERMHRLLIQSESEKERLSRCMTIGNIFYDEQMFDSARVYLEHVFNNQDDNVIKTQTAQWLLEVYNALGDTLKANLIAVFLSQFANAGDLYGTVDASLTELYHHYGENYLKRRHLTETRKAKIWFWLIVGFLAALALGFFLVQRTLQKTQQKQTRTKYNEDLLRERERYRLLADDHLSLKQKVKSLETPVKLSRKDYDELMEEPICINLRQRFFGKDILTTNKVSSYSNLAITSKQQRLFVNAIENRCPQFAATLLGRYSKLTLRDIMFCRFVLIGLTEKEISVLIQIDYSNAWRRANRIKEIMATKDIRQSLISIFYA